MANIQIPITKNGTVTLATAGKYCDRNIDVNVNAPDRYEEGKQAAYDAFWDSFQVNGTKRNYNYAFAGTGWQDDTFNPKYPIVAESAQYTFYYNTNITSTKVPITIDASIAPYFFGACRNLVTIPSLTVPANLKYEKMFSNCGSLQNITFTEDSVIDKDGLSFSVCTLLTRESVQSILNALSSNGTGKTITFNKAMHTRLLESGEWNAEDENGISLNSLYTQKIEAGWDIAFA